MIYYFCGHRGCGKNFLVNQIIKEVPIEIIDTGPIIREVYSKYNKDNYTFKEWMEFNEKKYGENFSNMLITKMVNIKEEKDYIVIGYRSIEGIKYFNKAFNIKDFKVYFIDGDYELFRKNYNKRENRNITQKEYNGIIELENSMGIEKLKEFVLNNESNGKYYYKEKNDDIIYEDIILEIKNNIEKLKSERER